MDLYTFIDTIYCANDLVNSLYVCSIMEIPFIASKTVNYCEYTIINNNLVSNNKKTNRKLRIYRYSDKKITIQVLPKGAVRLSINFTNKFNKIIMKEILINKIILLLTLVIMDNAKILDVNINEDTVQEYITYELNNIKFTSLSGYIKSSDSLICANGHSLLELRKSVDEVQQNITI